MAFVILSLVLTLIFRVISGTLNNIGTANGYAKALLLAESKMAQLGSEIPLVLGETSGNEENLSWKITVVPFDEASDKQPLNLVEQVIPLYQTLVQVSWQQSRKRRTLQLDSLRIKDEPQAVP